MAPPPAPARLMAVTRAPHEEEVALKPLGLHGLLAQPLTPLGSGDAGSLAVVSETQLSCSASLNEDASIEGHRC